METKHGQEEVSGSDMLFLVPNRHLRLIIISCILIVVIQWKPTHYFATCKLSQDIMIIQILWRGVKTIQTFSALFWIFTLFFKVKRRTHKRCTVMDPHT